MKASIAIFQKKIDYPKREVKPEVPDDVFEAALRVIENKSCELVKTNGGIYIVSFSETGPWQLETSKLIQQNWLPVYIARMEKWSSGGILESELQQFNESKIKNP